MNQLRSLPALSDSCVRSLLHAIEGNVEWSQSMDDHQWWLKRWLVSSEDAQVEEKCDGSSFRRFPVQAMPTNLSTRYYITSTYCP